MLEVNEYFDGAVKSIGLNNANGRSTVGVMASGEYEFSTGSIEIMTVISGELTVQLPGSTEWQVFTEGESFEVAADTSFKVQVKTETAYHCSYK